MKARMHEAREGFNKTNFVAWTQIHKKSLFWYFQTSEAPIFGKEIISARDVVTAPRIEKQPTVVT